MHLFFYSFGGRNGITAEIKRTKTNTTKPIPPQLPQENKIKTQTTSKVRKNFAIQKKIKYNWRINQYAGLVSKT